MFFLIFFTGYIDEPLEIKMEEYNVQQRLKLIRVSIPVYDQLLKLKKNIDNNCHFI